MFWGPFWVIFGAKCVRESEAMRCGSETCFGFRCRQFQKRNVRGHRSRFPDWAMRFGGGFGDIFWVPFWVVLSAKFVRESDSALQLGDSGLGMCFGIRFGEFQLQKEILPHFRGFGMFSSLCRVWCVFVRFVFKTLFEAWVAFRSQFQNAIHFEVKNISPRLH